MKEFQHNESWGGGNETHAGGDEKQLIKFAWPNSSYLCGSGVKNSSCPGEENQNLLLGEDIENDLDSLFTLRHSRIFVKPVLWQLVQKECNLETSAMWISGSNHGLIHF